MPQLVRPDEKPVPPLACWGTYHGVCIRGDAVTEKKTEPKTAAAYATPALVEAARWCGFTAADGWPTEFDAGTIAFLQAGGLPPGPRIRPGDDTEWLLQRGRIADDWKTVLRLAIKAGQLPHRVEPRYVDGREVEPPFYFITAPALAAWLKSAGQEPSRHIAAWLDACSLQAQGAQEKPIQRSAAQDAAILAAIRHAKHDPLALPVNERGKPGIKAAVRDSLAGNALFVGRTVFEKAWGRLRQRGDIADRA